MVLGLIVFIGGITLIFFGIATIEGVASILMLIAGYLAFRFTAPWDSTEVFSNKSGMSSFLVAIGVGFYALMGMAIDQPGNFLYNKPLEILFCPAGSQLVRDTITLNPLPGRTDILQDFPCVTKFVTAEEDVRVVKRIGMFEVIGTRFIEYLVLGYFLLWLGNFMAKRKNRGRLMAQKSSENTFR